MVLGTYPLLESKPCQLSLLPAYSEQIVLTRGLRRAFRIPYRLSATL